MFSIISYIRKRWISEIIPADFGMLHLAWQATTAQSLAETLAFLSLSHFLSSWETFFLFFQSWQYIQWNGIGYSVRVQAPSSILIHCHSEGHNKKISHSLVLPRKYFKRVSVLHWPSSGVTVECFCHAYNQSLPDEFSCHSGCLITFYSKKQAPALVTIQYTLCIWTTYTYDPFC